MALNKKIGTLSTPTVTGNQAITGVGFQPKLVILFGTLFNAVGTNTARMSIGASDGTNEFTVAEHIQHGADPTNALTIKKTGSCLINLGSAGTAVLDGTMVSLDADGFTVNWTTVLASSYTISYICLGGADLANAYVGSMDLTTSTGNQSVTGLGTQPDSVMFFTGDTGTAATSSLNARLGLGAATATTARWAAAGASLDNVSTSQADRYFATDKCVLSVTNTAVNFAADFVSFDAGGFTINKTTAPGSITRIFYIALDGPSAKAGNLTQRTSVGTKAETGVGFTPSIELFGTTGSPAADALQTTLFLGFGAGVSATERRAMADYQSDGSLNTSNSSGAKAVGIWTTITNAEADISSQDADGFTLNWTTADATARHIGYLALGDAVATGTVSVGLATETQTAFSITPLRTKSVGQAVSNESGLSITAAKAYGLGLPVETDSAFSITKQKTFSLNIANESDNPFSVSINKAFQLNLCLEVDSALNVTPVLAGVTIIPVGLASETDIVQGLSINRAYTLNLATELDSALLVTPVLAGITIVPVGLVGEIDIAQSLAINRTYSLGLANESDVGLSAIPIFSRTIITGIAQEVNFPFSISILKAFNIGQAIETDSALSVILAGGSIGRFSAGNKILLTGRIYNQIVLTGRTSNRVDIFND